MHKWGRNRVQPSPLCECEGTVHRFYRRCHGTSECCNQNEGLVCYTTSNREWERFK